MVELTLSDISDIEEELRQLPGDDHPSTARPLGYTNEPSASNARYIDTTVPPHRSYSFPNGTPHHNISSGFGISTSPPVRTFSPEPIVTHATVLSTTEPPTKVYSNIQDVRDATGAKMPTVGRQQRRQPTPLEWREEEGGRPSATPVTDWETGTKGQKINQSAAAAGTSSQLLDMQPRTGVTPSPHEEDPHSSETSSTSAVAAPAAAAAENTPEGSHSGEKIRRKGKEEQRGGEQKHKGTIMKKLVGMFR